MISNLEVRGRTNMSQQIVLVLAHVVDLRTSVKAEQVRRQKCKSPVSPTIVLKTDFEFKAI